MNQEDVSVRHLLGLMGRKLGSRTPMSDAPSAHEWDFAAVDNEEWDVHYPGGHAVVTTTSAGFPQCPDFSISGRAHRDHGERNAIFCAEILRLARELHYAKLRETQWSRKIDHAERSIRQLQKREKELLSFAQRVFERGTPLQAEEARAVLRKEPA